MTLSSDFIQDLYQAVDAKDIHALANMLHPNVSFIFSNSEPVIGIDDVKAINEQFFASIQSMSHTFFGTFQDDNHLICDGKVDYVRLDGTRHSAKFATVLRLQDGLIHEYKIYADLSGL